MASNLVELKVLRECPAVRPFDVCHLKFYRKKSLRNEVGRTFPKQERQPVDLRGLFRF